MGWGTCYVDTQGYLNRVTIDQIDDEIEEVDRQIEEVREEQTKYSRWLPQTRDELLSGSMQIT
jgi:hypothetical protein